LPSLNQNPKNSLKWDTNETRSEEAVSLHRGIQEAVWIELLHTQVAETPWSDLPIEPGLEYTIKLELGQDQIDLLRSTLSE